MELTNTAMNKRGKEKVEMSWPEMTETKLKKNNFRNCHPTTDGVLLCTYTPKSRQIAQLHFDCTLAILI